MYIFGKNVAREKINSGEKINKIYISDKFRDEEIFNLIKKKKIKYSIVPNKFLDNNSVKICIKISTIFFPKIKSTEQNNLCSS